MSKFTPEQIVQLKINPEQRVMILGEPDTVRAAYEGTWFFGSHPPSAKQQPTLGYHTRRMDGTAEIYAEHELQEIPNSDCVHYRWNTRVAHGECCCEERAVSGRDSWCVSVSCQYHSKA